MNRQPDVELVLRDYFADDGFFAPNHVLDVVEERIAGQPRRLAWRLRGRPFLNAQLKLAAGIAALLVIGIVGWQLLPRSNGVGGPEPTATPIVTSAPTPTVAPTSAGVQDVPDSGATLSPGRWRFHPAADIVHVSVVADVPAGWLAVDQQHGLENVAATNSAPSGIAILFEAPAHGIFSDPCHWDLDGTGTFDQEGDVKIGRKVIDLVNALRANKSFTSSKARAVSFGSYSGQQLELALPADLDPATCDAEKGSEGGFYRIMPDTIYAQGPANIWDMSIVDIAGSRLVAILEYFPGTAPDKVAEARAIIESLEFTP